MPNRDDKYRQPPQLTADETAWVRKVINEHFAHDKPASAPPQGQGGSTGAMPAGGGVSTSGKL